MKYFKKLAGVLLALVMVMALAAPAFAVNTPGTPEGDPSSLEDTTDQTGTTTDTGTGSGATTDSTKASITIQPASSDTGTTTTTYTYYQLLRASIQGNAVSYYLNNTDNDLKELLDAVKVGEDDLFTFTKSADGTRWNVSLNKKAKGGDFTGAEIADALNTDAIRGAALASSTFIADTTGVAKAENLEKGYYLITASNGTNLILDTLGDETITAKNENFTTEKTASATNMSVGQHVEYTIEVSIPASAVVGDTVTVHDTIDKELAILNQDEEIAASEGDYHITASYGTPAVTVTLGTDDEKEDTETFVRSFQITKEMLGKSVFVTYKAELLSAAANDTGYVNSAFSHTSSYETLPSTVDVYTFDFDLDKNFTGAADDNTKVATFKLTDSGNNNIEFVKKGDNYVKADSTAESTDTTTTIEVNGKTNVKISGLAAGTYTLTELSTADGYNLLTEPVIITIEDTSATVGGVKTISHKVTYQLGENGDVIDENNHVVAVENNMGSELPSTGGIGTTIFYIVGGVLVVGAVVLLITKRRAGVDEE